MIVKNDESPNSSKGRKLGLPVYKSEFTLEDELSNLAYDGSSFFIFSILLECTKNNIESVSFDTFIRGYYAADEDILDCLLDYENLAEYFYQQLQFISKEYSLLSFFKIDRLIIDDESVIQEILYSFKNSDHSEQAASYHAMTISSLYRLKHPLLDKEKRPIYYEKVVVAPVQFKNYSVELLAHAPKSIAIGFSLDKEKALKTAQQLNGYLLSSYDEEEIEHFCDYISNLKFVNGTIKVPFSALSEKKFHAAETLKYLEIEGRIKIKSWIGNEGCWEVKLLSNDLLSVFIPNMHLIAKDEKGQSPKEKASKVSIRLDDKEKILFLNKGRVIISKSKYQLDLLKVLLKEQPIDSDLCFSEIAESADHSYSNSSGQTQEKMKKRYSNAAYQLSKKIALETGKKDLFVMSSHMIRFNPKYQIKIS